LPFSVTFNKQSRPFCKAQCKQCTHMTGTQMVLTSLSAFSRDSSVVAIHQTARETPPDDIHVAGDRKGQHIQVIMCHGPSTGSSFQVPVQQIFETGISITIIDPRAGTDAVVQSDPSRAKKFIRSSYPSRPTSGVSSLNFNRPSGLGESNSQASTNNLPGQWPHRQAQGVELTLTAWS
jgi:hypothetical protein